MCIRDRCEEGLAYFQFGEEGVEVSLSMPKTDISDANSLVDALKALGIEAPFGASADFSGISEAVSYTHLFMIPPCIQN